MSFCHLVFTIVSWVFLYTRDVDAQVKVLHLPETTIYDDAEQTSSHSFIRMLFRNFPHCVRRRMPTFWPLHPDFVSEVSIKSCKHTLLACASATSIGTASSAAVLPRIVSKICKGTRRRRCVDFDQHTAIQQSASADRVSQSGRCRFLDLFISWRVS